MWLLVLQKLLWRCSVSGFLVYKAKWLESFAAT